MRAGLLHTVPALAGTFQTAIEKELPGVDLVHLADADLLATARRDGVLPELEQRVAARIDALITAGAEAVLVTCSSIGEAVEKAAAGASVPVLRVDAPMAAEAVRIATAAAHPGRIRVLATLQATLGPTGRLLEREAAGSGVVVTSEVVPGAIEARESGDQAEHDRLVLAAARTAADEADVVVFAQASMAAALGDERLRVPVLTSPAGGVASLITALRSSS